MKNSHWSLIFYMRLRSWIRLCFMTNEADHTYSCELLLRSLWSTPHYVGSAQHRSVPNIRRYHILFTSASHCLLSLAPPENCYFSLLKPKKKRSAPWPLLSPSALQHCLLPLSAHKSPLQLNMVPVSISIAFVQNCIPHTLNCLGSFCQGYSPGGGDSCMTVPAGCYIVPSGYNVVPALTCTASTSSSGSPSASSIPTTSSSPPKPLSTTTSFSSTAAPLSSSAVSIAISTAKSFSSSAAPSSSSVVSIAISTAKSVQASSSASTLQINSIVSLPSSVAASNPSSSTLPPSASITAPASKTAGTSPASSSAIQSSALPVALSGAIGKVTDAQNAGKTFKDSPSTDTQNTVKQAVDDAKNGKITLLFMLSEADGQKFSRPEGKRCNRSPKD